MKNLIVIIISSILTGVCARAEDQSALPVADGPFKPTQASLMTYQYPEWFRDAKFGIWSHWGPQARFTTSKDGKTLYAILLGWPESGKVVIKTLGSGSKHYPGEIGKIGLLGSSEAIQLTRDASGLVVELPKSKPCEFAYSLKITPKAN